MSQSQKPLGAYLMRNIKSHFCVFIFAGFFAFLILEFLKLIMLWCFLTQKKNVSYYNAFPYWLVGLWRTRQTEDPDTDPETHVKTTLRELIIYLVFITILCICKYWKEYFGVVIIVSPFFVWWRLIDNMKKVILNSVGT